MRGSTWVAGEQQADAAGEQDEASPSGEAPAQTPPAPQALPTPPGAPPAQPAPPPQNAALAQPPAPPQSAAPPVQAPTPAPVEQTQPPVPVPAPLPTPTPLPAPIPPPAAPPVPPAASATAPVAPAPLPTPSTAIAPPPPRALPTPPAATTPPPPRQDLPTPSTAAATTPPPPQAPSTAAPAAPPPLTQFHQLMKHARRLQGGESLDLRAAAQVLAQAAELVEPGPDRAFALSQLARTYLRLDQPDGAITVLLSEQDWPHHLPTAFEILTKAAGQASAVEPFRWLATCPAQHHEPSPQVFERALGIALYRNDYDYGEQILTLASELYPPEDVNVALLKGRLRDRQKRQSEAIDAYLQAARLGTRDARCYSRLTTLLNKTRRLNETLEWCRRGLELGLDAATQRQLEKILVARTALPGGKRSALETILPLYIRRGEALVERVAQLPIAPNRAVQTGELTWALGTRSGNPHLFPCKVETAEAMGFQAPFVPREFFVRTGGQICLALGLHGAEWQAMMLAANGASAVFPLPDKPRNVSVLPDRCIFSFRDGTIEARTWNGQPAWQVRFARNAFAYWLSGGEDRALVTYMDWVYELVPETGQDAGHASVKTAPGIAAGGAARTAGSRRAWIQGLGFIGERAFGLFHGGLYEIGRGARLELLEAISPEDPLYRMVSDSDGELIALRAEASMRTVGLDGKLSEPFPTPTGNHHLERLGATRFVRHSSRVIATIDADGTEMHRFETADPIRSVRVIGEKELRVVVGREVLRVRLDEQQGPRLADRLEQTIPPLTLDVR